MSTFVPNSQAVEPRLVRLYMELTGLGESAARNVFMHVCCRDCGTNGMKPVIQMECEADTASASTLVGSLRQGTAAAILLAGFLAGSLPIQASDASSGL